MWSFLGFLGPFPWHLVLTVPRPERIVLPSAPVLLSADRGWPTLQELTSRKHPCCIPPSCASSVTTSWGILAPPGSSTGRSDLYRPSLCHILTVSPRRHIVISPLPPLPLSSLPTNTVHALRPADSRNAVSCPDRAASGQGVSDWLELTTLSPHLPHDQGIPLLGPHPTEIKTQAPSSLLHCSPQIGEIRLSTTRQWVKSRGMSSRASCSAMERKKWAP